MRVIFARHAALCSAWLVLSTLQSESCNADAGHRVGPMTTDYTPRTDLHSEGGRGYTDEFPVLQAQAEIGSMGMYIASASGTSASVSLEA
jgi:hypothetical protein